MAAALREEPDVTSVDCARSVDEALDLTAQQAYDVALVNINLPDNDALRFTRTLARTKATTKVLITGLVQSKAAVLRCIEAGAAGYILEEDSLTDLIKRMRAVYANQALVAPNMASALISRVAELKRKVTEIRAMTKSTILTQPAELTPREWEILHLIEQGFSNQAIADKLVIELGTVKNHVHNILRKLDVQNRKHAVVFARQMLAQEKANQPATTLPLAYPASDGRLAATNNARYPSSPAYALA
jgi:DNA-binding NarL/FixJ family response regulator